MEKIVIEGGTALHGTLRASGAKNAALPILIATLLAPGEHRLTNVPALTDTSYTLSLLGRLGCPSLIGPDSIRLDTTRVAFNEAPYDVVRKMRASVLVLGPLLARCGEAHVSLPGGCAIGTRPIDQHLKGLEALGCTFELSGGMIHGRADDLHGADFTFDVVTVTGTENVVMAAVLARGTSVLRNAAMEPEVVDLCNFLVSIGARIEGIGTDTLTVEGVPRLWAASRPYRILPDRIETGTYLCAAAVTGGDITVTGTDPGILGSVLDVLRAAGCEITTGADWIRCRRTGPLTPFEVTTAPYPDFPTDMQAQLMTVAALANGQSRIEETIFENRFMHAAELRRMGASLHHTSSVATIDGVEGLQGAAVMASDLRASAALVLAGLAATGLTEVLRIYHLDRGYENLVGKLRGVGARIGRVSDAVTDPGAMKRSLSAPEFEAIA
ncbi:MAG: UDP-N-acetylglucosamine 1-carboxyvinyltransferase [Alphaproteobacteria bacterium]|nr:UDP-N-acetylglucosamine 1-carboxyvinyltransferase [Alphaproteobacteria bacterium]